MQDKKDESEEMTDVERHVDEMMDRTKHAGEPRSAMSGAPDLPEIDIFKDAAASVGVATEASADTTEPTNETSEEIVEDKTVDNAAVDPLVDDIVSKEGDDLLMAQDAEIAHAFESQTPGQGSRIREFLQSWWDSKPARYGTIVVVAAILLTAAVIPRSRYGMLNTAGVRAAASLTILDNTTNLPLKNVSVSLGNTTAKTNQDGVVHLQHLKLGTTQLTVRQLGFAPVSRQVILGLGSNPLGEVGLKAVGTQLRFKLTDYVSGKAVGNGEASSGDANAQADDKGNVVLTIGKIDQPKIDVVVTATGYRSEKVTIDVQATQSTSVTMVTKRKEVFISKQSGRYDLYKVDIDGKNRQLLLAGTGTERDQIGLVSHPTNEMVALVSSRDNKRDGDGYLLDTLTIVNVDNGSTISLDSSERIQIVDWVKDKLVYVKVKAGASAGSPDRYQLISYDYNAASRLQLATANYFTDVVSAKGAIYYAASNNYPGGQSLVGRVNPDNTGKQNLLNGDVWNIDRADYETLNLSGSQGWYGYHLGDDSAHKLAQQPASANGSKLYLSSPDGKHALWIDARDGKGVLLSYDTSSKKDAILATQSGLTYPVRWLDNHTVVYRNVSSSETAAYVLDLDGGQPKKIADITDTSGLGKWRYW